MTEPLSKSLRREARQKERLADIADALGAGGLSVAGFSPLSEWVLPAMCEGCGCELEAGHCYCCLPVSGYGESFYEARHPNGIKNAGRFGRDAVPLDEYVRVLSGGEG